ncbi:small GTP-binding protein [Psychromonas ingrahamii 37]|uniref:GTPase Der n=2 Tax=Psychromonas TaxID=67572 RepID=DER_PSYIN|nr:ribosome biogenesis GTPase Der [Psychromonas ingrahamii]A1SU43.1 RecName: Full=GTPase Der; AltName: Full=GTP-binding protein EngA [Psychromonas ingrahamii 37]ABM03008.1 small GTP-binding protein [Psychromonas ingrahamii 37]
MLPVVALVGRPNVGKSTLFNRLTRTRDALVADFPGLTRDRKYGQAKIDEHEFIVIDTGGITGDEEGIDALMAGQSLLAIDEADAVLFLVDARAGMTIADEAIADHLRKQDKKVFVVANKTDGVDADSVCAEFYALGLGEVYHIAAAQGKGVRQMIEIALDGFFDDVEQEDDFSDLETGLEFVEEDEALLLKEQERLAALPIKLALIGRPNVGKSTLTNRILGEERVLVYDLPGTTRDSIYIPMSRDDREYILIDTAGVRKRKKVNETVEKFSVIKTLQAIEDCNVVLLIIDARDGISDQDLSLLGFTLNAGRSLVIAVNKWDGMTEYDKERVKSELDRRLGFIDFAKIHFISALHGTGVGHLYESVEEAYDSSTKRISTSILTRIMTMAAADHEPPMVGSRRVKLRYAHAGGYNPPLIVIHGNQVKKLADSYKRYLMNYFRRSLGIMGTPIRIEFREGTNPFAGRRNKLTPNQMYKRQRLVKFHKKSKK